jgi:D-alanyl-D-alanine carboxypeptidase-like protein
MPGKRLLALAVAASLLGAVPATAATEGKPRFWGKVSTIGPKLRDSMTPTSWRPGCPVPLRDLRLLTVRHRGFDGKLRTGHLIVHEDYAKDVVRVFRKLFDAGFPVRRMRLIDAYAGSDFRSIEADNTSAFNCRPATGSGSWSEHAYGRAIDLNPIENPYVEAGRIYHDASARYADRSRRLKGMVHAGDVVVNAFASIGWGWGGSWSGSVRDYQHFSASGR